MIQVVGDGPIFDACMEDFPHFNESSISALIMIQHEHILSEDEIERFGGYVFNLHNAKLPEYRGSWSISWALYNGEKEYTTTIHWVVPRVDAGDIAYETTFPIDFKDDVVSLYEKSKWFAVVNFRRLVSDLLMGNEIPRKQQDGNPMFYTKKSKERLPGYLDVDPRR